MTTVPSSKPTTVSREELFRQVWTTPMSRLAREYGISGNGLAKICDRLKVPCPPRGYWAKKAAGKKVVEYRLPEPEEGTPRTATINPTPPPASPPPIPPEVRQEADATRRAVGAVAVADRLLKPHPAVAAWLREREEARARARRDPLLRSLVPSEWTEAERRRHRILDALFKAAEKHGITVKQPDRYTTYFEASGERIDFKLKEKHKRVRAPKAPEEIKRLLPGEKPWRQELQPTGTLVFSIETYLPTLPQRSWSDMAAQALEEQVGDILSSLVLAGPLLVEQRREREAAEKRRREEEYRRYQQAERRRADDNRWRRFTELAERWQQADQVRGFLQALELHPGAAGNLDGGESLSKWLDWARARLAAFDPMEDGPAGVFEEVLTVTAWTYRE